MLTQAENQQIKQDVADLDASHSQQLQELRDKLARLESNSKDAAPNQKSISLIANGTKKDLEMEENSHKPHSGEIPPRLDTIEGAVARNSQRSTKAADDRANQTQSQIEELQK